MPVEPDVLTAEQQEVLKTYELGRRLFDTTNTKGWQDVLDVLEKEVQKAEFRLMNFRINDEVETLRYLHASAQVSRQLFEQLQLQVATAIEVGRTLPQQHIEPQYSINNF